MFWTLSHTHTHTHTHTQQWKVEKHLNNQQQREPIIKHSSHNDDYTVHCFTAGLQTIDHLTRHTDTIIHETVRSSVCRTEEPRCSFDLNAAEKRAVVGAAGDLQRLQQRLFHGSPVAPREVCLELQQRRNVSRTVGERRKRKTTSASSKRLLKLKVESAGFSLSCSWTHHRDS